MKNNIIKFQAVLIICLLLSSFAFSQYAYFGDNKSAYRLAAILSKTEDSLMKQFQNKNLTWPPTSIYVRSFKYDRQLEVWVKDDSLNKFRLFKTYKICMQSGTMGPKRMEGDYQVPEGFYHINEFNPNSNYHLSLGINYPNASDRILSDSLKPGGSIFIHGNCVSTGCIAITDEPIEELYVLASEAKNKGQEFIPVHIFPVRYSNSNSLEYLNNNIKDNTYLQHFNKNIREVFDFFEANKELPVILVNRRGEYVVN
jgi:murein L,D-transpeptidase YafK